MKKIPNWFILKKFNQHNFIRNYSNSKPKIIVHLQCILSINKIEWLSTCTSTLCELKYSYTHKRNKRSLLKQLVWMYNTSGCHFENVCSLTCLYRIWHNQLLLSTSLILLYSHYIEYTHTTHIVSANKKKKKKKILCVPAENVWRRVTVRKLVLNI